MTLHREIRVFLASPSDAAAERAEVERIAGYLQYPLNSKLVELQIVGWQSVSGTAQRPQTAINQLIDSCDFMICIFKSKWGSDPGGGLYSSGTEEELFTGLLALGLPTHRLRDVCLIFIEYDENVRDREIEELKDQVISTHSMLFKAPKSPIEFSEDIRKLLTGWGDSSVGKTVKFFDLKPRSGKDVLRAREHSTRGEEYAALGRVAEADIEFCKSVEIGGPTEKLAYAVFLGRQRRIAEALRYSEDAINLLLKDSIRRPIPVAEALVIKASLLRRTQDLASAGAVLRLAQRYLQGTSPVEKKILARTHDELGVILYKQALDSRRACDMDSFARLTKESQEELDKGLRIRQILEDAAGVAQSSINISRLDVALGQYDRAIESQTRAIDALKNLDDLTTLANAFLGKAQALFETQTINIYSTRQ